MNAFTFPGHRLNIALHVSRQWHSLLKISLFFLDFGWSGAFDVVRDLDLSIPESGSGMWTYLEANLMIVTYLFRHKLE